MQLFKALAILGVFLVVDLCWSRTEMLGLGIALMTLKDVVLSAHMSLEHVKMGERRAFANEALETLPVFLMDKVFVVLVHDVWPRDHEVFASEGNVFLLRDFWDFCGGFRGLFLCFLLQFCLVSCRRATRRAASCQTSSFRISSGRLGAPHWPIFSPKLD
jgi:hypothetical protein